MSSRLFGNYDHSLDAKGRLNIPAKMRKDLCDEYDEFYVTCYVAIGKDGTETNCLAAITSARWDMILQAAEDLPEEDEADMRIFMARTEKYKLDANGRFILTQNQRDYAGLDRDVVIAGMGKRAEIWDAAKWKESQEGKDTAEAALSIKRKLRI